MKKVIIISSMVSALFCGGISGVSYFNYAIGDVDADEAHGFSIERVYFTYTNDVSENVKFKFQTDVVNQEGDGLQLYLKNANMEYAATKNITFIYGLQGMNIFGDQETNWGNRYLAKISMDENKWGPSADLGVGVLVNFNRMTASVLLTNGEGYKNTSVDGNERISAAVGYYYGDIDDMSFNVGGVSSILNYDAVVSTDDTEDRAGGTETLMGVFGGFSGFGFKGGAEYNMGTDLNLNEYATNATLMSLYGNYAISFVRDLSILVRYDILDTDTEADDTETTTLLTGVSYQCAEGITFSPNMTQRTVGAEDPTTEVNLTFQLKF